MVTPTAGAIVLVPFPFSDLSQTKLRPALVLADVGRGDWILCQITSNSYGDPHAIPISNADLDSGTLRVSSYLRPGKLFTAHANLMVASVAQLEPKVFNQVLNAVTKIFRPPPSP
jgi:mRNA interferase MazF